MYLREIAIVRGPHPDYTVASVGGKVQDLAVWDVHEEPYTGADKVTFTRFWSQCNSRLGPKMKLVIYHTAAMARIQLWCHAVIGIVVDILLQRHKNPLKFSNLVVNGCYMVRRALPKTVVLRYNTTPTPLHATMVSAVPVLIVTMPNGDKQHLLVDITTPRKMTIQPIPESAQSQQISILENYTTCHELLKLPDFTQLLVDEVVVPIQTIIRSIVRRDKNRRKREKRKLKKQQLASA